MLRHRGWYWHPSFEATANSARAWAVVQHPFWVGQAGFPWTGRVKEKNQSRGYLPASIPFLVAGRPANPRSKPFLPTASRAEKHRNGPLRAYYRDDRAWAVTPGRRDGHAREHSPRLPKKQAARTAFGCRTTRERFAYPEPVIHHGHGPKKRINPSDVFPISGKKRGINKTDATNVHIC
ncbi:MAG: hypothetical protein BWY17_04172 [Deltaproteobacteria bacterium ADurb.Bin207]|nr:MAG: hypothetical protein BWY17_04172 [Deltaproteobacteria bacterium ADurb.Bin207]